MSDDVENVKIGKGLGSSLKATAFVVGALLLGLLSMRWIYQESPPGSVYLVPHGFRGPVAVLFDPRLGTPYTTEGRRRVYRVGHDGLAIIRGDFDHQRDGLEARLVREGMDGRLERLRLSFGSATSKTVWQGANLRSGGPLRVTCGEVVWEIPAGAVAFVVTKPIDDTFYFRDTWVALGRVGERYLDQRTPADNRSSPCLLTLNGDTDSRPLHHAPR